MQRRAGLAGRWRFFTYVPSIGCPRFTEQRFFHRCEPGEEEGPRENNTVARMACKATNHRAEEAAARSFDPRAKAERRRRAGLNGAYACAGRSCSSARASLNPTWMTYGVFVFVVDQSITFTGTGMKIYIFIIVWLHTINIVPPRTWSSEFLESSTYIRARLLNLAKVPNIIFVQPFCKKKEEKTRGVKISGSRAPMLPF